MGTLQLSEFRDEIRYQISNRSDLDDSDSTVAARLNRWVNISARWVGLPAVFEHPELKTSATVTLVDGTDSYTVASDLYAIRFVVNETQDFKYDPQTERDFYDRGSAARLYARSDSNDILIEGTDQNDGDIVRVYYWAYHSAMSTDAATTDVGDYFDDVILARATALGHAALGELDRADYWMSYVADMINDHAPPSRFEARDDGWRNEHIRTGNAVMGRGK